MHIYETPSFPIGVSSSFATASMDVFGRSRNKDQSKQWKFLIAAGAICLIVYYTFFSGKSVHRRYVDPDHTNYKSQYDTITESFNSLPIGSPVRAQLAFNFPYDSTRPIPKMIHQTWKEPVHSDKFPVQFKKNVKSWQNKNENYSYNMIPDELMDTFVHDTFANVDDVVKSWDLLPKGVMRADFFRYLVVFARGGVYSDMDTMCLKPIDKWAVSQQEYLSNVYRNGMKFSSLRKRDNQAKQNDDYGQPKNAEKYGLYDESDSSESLIAEDTRDSSVGLVIGIEADPDRKDWAEWYARRIQFVQWTIMGKKGHPMLRELIARIVEETLRKESMGKLRRVEGKDKGDDIMNWTGPGIFTDTVFDYMNNILPGSQTGSGFGIGSKVYKDGQKWKLKGMKELDQNNMPKYSSQMEINWETFTGMEYPGIVDDIMVLPITSFSPGVGQMGSRSESHSLAFVKHLFEGTWKPESERM